MKSHRFLLWFAICGFLIASCHSQDVDDEDDDVEVVADAETAAKEKKKTDEPDIYERPVIALEHEDAVYLSEAFATEDEFKTRWIQSQAKKDGVDAEISKYDGKWSLEEPASKLFIGDFGLVLKSKARHHAISSKLQKEFSFEDKPLVIQYEVKFQKPLDCGGAYVKLLSARDDLDLNLFQDKTPYIIMFGPDKCGEDKKLHFIFRYKNPKDGSFEEKHSKPPTGNFQSVFDGKKTHLFTLVVRPDNSYEIFVDQESVSSGNLLEDFTPAINPPKEVDDPDDKKPEDWDEREKFPDPDAEKPDDWDEDAPVKIADANAKKPADWLDDEPDHISDPNSVKPTDWDDDEDGQWEAGQIANPKCETTGCGEWKPPIIDNPDYKGKWAPPLIDNPDYKGIWKPRKIANPDYFEDKEPFKMSPISAVGLELWSMSEDILFDNFILTDDKYVADKWAEQGWVKKNTVETSGGSDQGGIASNLIDATTERPWLWVLLVIVVILPFVLIAVFCFPGGKGDADAKKKKTDAPTADVDEKEEEDQAEDKEEEGEDDAEEEQVEEQEKEKEKEAEDEGENKVEDEAVEDEAVEDKAVEDEAVEDEAVEDEAVEDEAVEDEAVKDENETVKVDDNDSKPTTRRRARKEN